MSDYFADYLAADTAYFDDEDDFDDDFEEDEDDGDGDTAGRRARRRRRRRRRRARRRRRRKRWGRAFKKVGRAVKKGVKAITDNPVFDAVATGASFIPGVGTAVSAGMKATQAFGRGKSLKDIGLAAARGALPGGPAAKAAFDVGVGLVKGEGFDPDALRAARDAIPGGEQGRAAFDAAIAITSKATGKQQEAARRRLSPPAAQAFDKAVGAANRSKSPRPYTGTSWDALGRAARKQIAKKKKRSPFKSTRRLRRRALKLRQRDESSRPFPSLTLGGNKVARTLRGGTYRSRTARDLASALTVDEREARDAIAAFLKRHGAKVDWRDVSGYDTLDQAADRHGVRLPRDLSYLPDTDGDELEVVEMPPVAISRKWLQRLFELGDANLRKAILAHELLPAIAQNTGELDGKGGWVVRSGDIPWKVAKELTGDGNRWKEIPKVNPGMKIYKDAKGNTQLSGWYPGKRVQLPPGWVSSAVPIDVAPEELGQNGEPPFPSPSQYPSGYPTPTYRVQEGDTGEKIAEKITGDKNRWRELLKENPKLASEKYGIALYAGKTIKLPATWVKPQKSPEVIAAEQEAKKPEPADEPTPALPTPGAPIPAGPGMKTEPEPPGEIEPLPLPRKTEREAAPPVAIVEPPPEAEDEDDTPPVVGSEQQIATVQVMLGYFMQAHPEVTWTLDEAPYGSTPEDYDGEWSERTTAALLAFQKWWNRAGKKPFLEEDGLPDEESVAALSATLDVKIGVKSPKPAAPAPVPSTAPAPPPKPAAPGKTVPTAPGGAATAKKAGEATAPAKPPPKKKGSGAGAAIAAIAAGLTLAAL